MKNLKKCLAIIIIIFAFMIQTSVFALAINEYKTTQTIAPGVTLTQVDAYYSGFDLTYSYVTADLTNEKVALSLLKSPKGINERDTVMNLAASEENVVAATNCDFFAMSSNSYSQGIEVKDGRILQSPIDTNSFAGGFVYDDNRLVLSNIDFHVMIVAPNLEYREVYRINKPMELYGLLLMYTSDYNGGYSPAPGDGVVEMIVDSDGIVTGFNRGKTPVKIPENGYVLAISEMDNFISANFKEGDSVKIEQYITPTIENLQTAFGGGSLLLKDGQICEFTNNITGNNPRTAVGTDETGKKVILLTVDGRSGASAGLTQTMLANLMLELGCKNALNLDGGGSTQMVAKTWDVQGLKIVNNPTENRRVINALGIKTLEPGSDIPANLRLLSDKEAVYKGTEVNLTLEAANSAFTRLYTDTSGAVYNTDKVSNNKFKSDEGGEFIINANLNGIESNSITIKVVDDIAGISVPRIYNMEKVGDERRLEISVFDESGSFVSAPVNEFEINISGDCAKIENGSIIAQNEGEAIMSIKKGDVCSYSKIIVEGARGKNVLPLNSVSDSLNKDAAGDKTFVFTALADDGKTLFDTLYAGKLASILPAYDQAGVLGNQVHPFLDNIYCVNYDKYMFLEKDGAAFISLPVKNGSVRSANGYALDNLMMDIYNTSAKNVFITADGYLNLSGREGDAIKGLLSRCDKNIFVISKGETDNVEIIDSVRYFTIADNHSYSGAAESVKSLKMLKFSMKDNNVTYSFENIYK